MMPKVPETPQFKPSSTDKTIYCFPPGTSEADKQHDIEQINKFIEHVRAKRKKSAPPTMNITGNKERE